MPAGAAVWKSGGSIGNGLCARGQAKGRLPVVGGPQPYRGPYWLWYSA